MESKREIKFRCWCPFNEEMYTDENSPEYTFSVSHGKVSFLPNYETNELNYFYEGAVDGIDGYNIIPMQFIGIKDKNKVDVCEGDFAKFTPPVDKQAAFYNSNCGKIMIKNNIDELLIRFNLSDYLSLDYDVFFLINNKPVTQLYWFEKCGDNYSDATEQQLKELDVPYSQSDSDLHFIKYLSNKGIEVIGNIYQNPELITP